MAGSDSVSLTEADFGRYVPDQWRWRDRFDDYLSEMRVTQRGVSRRKARRA